jgi:hypothetical protein
LTFTIGSDRSGLTGDAAKFSAFVQFTSLTAFDLSFDSYTNTGPASSVSGLVLYETGAIDGTGANSLTNDTFACASSLTSAITADAGACDLLKTSGGTSATASAPGQILFAGVGPGEYVLGFYEFSDPIVSAQFTVTAAPIPLPAAGFLLVGALGGLAAMRRRKA